VLLALANAGEPLLGAVLLDRWMGRRSWTRRPAAVGRLLAAVTVATGASSVIGGSALALADGGVWWSTVIGWWTGDLLGVLVVAPPLLMVVSRQFDGRHLRELVVSSVLIAAGVGWLFLASTLPLSWVLFPLVGWMAVRYGLLGAATVSVIVSSVAFVAVAADQPFLAGLLQRSHGELLVHVMLITLVIGAYGLAAHIEQAERTAHAAVEGEASFRAVIDEAPVVIIEIDSADSTVVTWNASAAATFGVSAVDIVGRPIPLLGRELADHVQHRDRALHDPDARRFSVTRHGADGTEHHLDVAVHPRSTFDGRVLLTSIIHDRTHDVAAQTELRERLATDQLTGLASRAAIDEQLGDWIARSGGNDRHIAVFCDLDGFKGVNDSLGHRYGDELLVGVGERLRATVRPGDVVARLGGDEFVILAAVPCEPAILALVERVRNAFGSPFRLGDDLIGVGASVGYTIMRPDQTGADVLASADTAMYRDKRNRRHGQPSQAATT
jgi:diguanylate cyclase (GGDEF)-like protein/PAS domain S-box-containing protein